VTIVERGFLILDHKDQVRLLKPALVKRSAKLSNNKTEKG
jgi:hypothetical protein